MKINLDTIYNIDVLDGLSFLEDKSVNLIILDPPYNIGKDTWDKIKNYEEWMFSIFKECERVLSSTGSIYIFHNDFEVMSEFQHWIKRNTKFIFRNLLIWNKKFDGCSSEAYMNIAISTKKNRTFRKFAEYCLFYTFDDVTNLNYSHLKKEIYSPYRELIRSQMDISGLTWKDKIVVNTFLNNGSGKNYSVARQISQNKLNPEYDQLAVLSEKEYVFLKPLLKFSVSYEDIENVYKKLNVEFRERRKMYKKSSKHVLDELRYVFNKTEKHSIMNFQTPKNKSHICQKPEGLIDEIIRVSSNKGDIVLDPFLGSGTSVLSAKKLDRRYIGFEKDAKYFKEILEKINLKESH